jgi:hypothetical protein
VKVKFPELSLGALWAAIGSFKNWHQDVRLWLRAPHGVNLPVFDNFQSSALEIVKNQAFVRFVIHVI